MMIDTATNIQERLCAALDQSHREEFVQVVMDLICLFYAHDEADSEQLRQQLTESFGHRGCYRRDVDEVLAVWQEQSHAKLHFLSGTSGNRLLFDGEDRTIRYPRNPDYAQYHERFAALYGCDTIEL